MMRRVDDEEKQGEALAPCRNTFVQRADNRDRGALAIEGVKHGRVGFCETPEVLIYLTRWVRLRLRAALWRQWKTPRRRRAALLELGVSPRLASNTAGSGRGPWYLARAKALSVGLPNAYFKSLGLPSLVEEG